MRLLLTAPSVGKEQIGRTGGKMWSLLLFFLIKGGKNCCSHWPPLSFAEEETRLGATKEWMHWIGIVSVFSMAFRLLVFSMAFRLLVIRQTGKFRHADWHKMNLVNYGLGAYDVILTTCSIYNHEQQTFCFLIFIVFYGNSCFASYCLLFQLLHWTS